MGKIVNIQRMSYHDGPGIRTTVFFSGCNLRCGWCHNPESQKIQPQLQYFSQVCTSCGACVRNCPEKALTYDGKLIIRNLELCTGCFLCVDCCVPGARRISSREITADELCQKLSKDKSFYNRSGGGVTFSGGEPLLQFEFLMECLKKLKSTGIHTAIESAMCVSQTIVRQIVPYVNYFMCDIKAMDENIHIKHTGQSNKQILDNICLLSELDANVLIRMPLVEGVNDTPENLRAIAKFMLNQTNFRDIEILPLHLLSKNKYDSLSILDTMSNYVETSDEMLASVKKILRNEGLNIL